MSPWNTKASHLWKASRWICKYEASDTRLKFRTRHLLQLFLVCVLRHKVFASRSQVLPRVQSIAGVLASTRCYRSMWAQTVGGATSRTVGRKATITKKRDITKFFSRKLTFAWISLFSRNFGTTKIWSYVVCRSYQKSLASPIRHKLYVELHWRASQLLPFRSLQLLPQSKAWYWQCTLSSLFPFQVTRVCHVDIVPCPRRLIETLHLFYKILPTLLVFIRNRRLSEPTFNRKTMALLWHTCTKNCCTLPVRSRSCSETKLIVTTRKYALLSKHLTPP